MKFYHLIFVIVSCFFNCSASLAANAIVCTTPTDCLIGGYGTQQTGQMILLPTDSTAASTSGAAQSILLQSFLNPIADPTVDPALFMAIIFDTTYNIPNSNGFFNAIFHFDPVNTLLCSNLNGTNAACPSTAAQKSMDGIQFDNFFGPLTYTSNQQQNASNFIRLLTWKDDPIQFLDLVQFTLSKQTTLNNPIDYVNILNANQALKDYIGFARSFAIQHATAISNLVQIYNQRLPIGSGGSPEINNLLAVSGLNPATTSILALEEYMATRRISTPSWYTDLASNNPTMLQRQLVTIQAEALAEMYRLRMAIDRLTATTTVMMLGNHYTNRGLLYSLKNTLTSTAIMSNGATG